MENSGAATSVTQPGIVFGLNDSGHGPIIYATDSTGADRGRWRIKGAGNRDWEAISIGPCGVVGSAAAGTPTQSSPGAPSCLYVADVGDNGAERPFVSLYRIPEPLAMAADASGEVAGERLDVRYPDRRHDVEAAYVALNGDAFLITKRGLGDAQRKLRPALVFRVAASFWRTQGTSTAELIDSLPLVPGSAPRRQITDASLSRDGRRLAVRTYSEVYVYGMDAATGRVDHGMPHWSCPVSQLRESQGEGLTWWWDDTSLLLTSEGRNAPFWVLRCDRPAGP